MQDFFTARVDGYDAHMLGDIDGLENGYRKMAELLPAGITTLLDLGCGTGLELGEIFKVNTGVHVTGIDMTKAMLDRLIEKYPDRNITLINASYFDADFGAEAYDAAVSFQTLHHFTREEKLGLYLRLRNALKPGGLYIECDFMVDTQQEEDALFSENRRLRKELGIPDGAFYHVDTPCTVDNQRLTLKAAGFGAVQQVWRAGHSVMLTARK
jgi:SAM-dependent methyltransferase